MIYKEPDELLCKILYILINSYVNDIKNKEIAENLPCHRNVVSKYVNRFRIIRNEVILFVKANDELKNARPEKLYESSAAIAFSRRYIHRSNPRKCTDEIYNTIEKYCKKYLNCYRAAEGADKLFYAMYSESSKKLSREFGIDSDVAKDHIINYPDYHFSSYDYNEFGFETRDQCVKYMRKITHIRSYIHKCSTVPKNYAEVYEEFQKSKCYQATPISYSAFYHYARQMWIDVEFPHK